MFNNIHFVTLCFFVWTTSPCVIKQTVCSLTSG